MKSLKIAYFLPTVEVSGGVAVVFQHTNRLVKRGHEVVVIAPDHRTSTGWFPRQAVSVVPPDRLPDDLDILVATAWSTAFEVARLPAKHKCYFVQSDETRFHEYESPYFHVTQLSYLMNFHYLTEAKWIRNWLRENFEKQARLVPNGLDPELFHETKPLRKKSNKFRILLEGAIALPYKGMKEAFQVVNDMDVEVWCVSTLGRPHPSWKCDRFFEQVPMTRMKEIYSSCDILLKMSRVEGFFGPPLEMMACGGACVVGRVTGCDEYIVDGENALVVDPSDVPAARQALERLISDAELREKLKENGRKTSREWNWERSIDSLEEYFKEITENRHGKTNAVREQTNRSIVYFYETVTGASRPISSIAGVTRFPALKKVLRAVLGRLPARFQEYLR